LPAYVQEGAHHRHHRPGRSYLAELLLGKGYEVHGLIRRSSSFNTGRIDHLYRDPHQADVPLHLYYGDLSDSSSLINTLNLVRPDEVYNLGAQSHVKVSFEMPEFTADTTGMGTLRLLEAVHHADWPIRFYQAGSSEMFGKAREAPQRKQRPSTPQPVRRVEGLRHWMTIQYREAYGLFAVNGILSTTSPHDGQNVRHPQGHPGVADILAGREQKLYLGTSMLGETGDTLPSYVEAMWRMIQQPEPDDYVIATGEMHTVREFVEGRFRPGASGLARPRRDRSAATSARPRWTSCVASVEGGGEARLAPADGFLQIVRPHARERPRRCWP